VILFWWLVCQSLSGQELPFVQYTYLDGLPSMKTYDIVQDSSGLLWIGTENGLVSFDGDEFVTYTHPDLLDFDIVEIALNRNRRIYFLNLSEQLGYIENGKIYFIDTQSLKARINGVLTFPNGDFLEIAGEQKLIVEIRERPTQQFEFLETDIFFFLNDDTITRKGDEDFWSESNSIEIKRHEKRHMLYSEKGYYIGGDYTSQSMLYDIDTFLFEVIDSRRIIITIKVRRYIHFSMILSSIQYL